MKYIQKIHIIISLIFTASLTINAKSHEEKSIIKIAEDTGSFTTLLAAVDAAGLTEWVNNATPKTLFAPTDQAFDALPEGTVATLLLPENKQSLIRILQYHLVEGEVASTALTNGIVATTSSAGLKVSINGQVKLNDVSTVTTADIEAKNGIIHIVDAVLLPPTNNIVDLVANDPDLSTLTAALTAADLLDALRNSGPFTILAPTNAAFSALPSGTLESLLLPENKSTLQSILLYHVIASNVYSNNLSNGNAAALNGGSININLAGPIFEFSSGGANPTTVDILGTNGVIHKIDNVLLPSSDNLVETLVADGRFTTLLTATTQADLAEVLSSVQGATVFAPTDQAFGKLPASTLQFLLLPENKMLLKNVILYHVVNGTMHSNKLMSNIYATATGVELPIMVGTGGVTVNGSAKVVQADIISGNGVIHAVDQVILPPLNMADTLANNPNYSTLAAALKAAGLYDTLNTAGPFTLFAPTNAAFEKLATGTLETLLKPESVETLQSILLAHVLGEKKRSGQLTVEPQTTLQGKILNVHVVHGSLQIGSEAIISKANTPVWNGIIHTIDNVLIP